MLLPSVSQRFIPDSQVSSAALTSRVHPSVAASVLKCFRKRIFFASEAPIVLGVRVDDVRRGHHPPSGTGDKTGAAPEACAPQPRRGRSVLLLLLPALFPASAWLFVTPPPPPPAASSPVSAPHSLPQAPRRPGPLTAEGPGSGRFLSPECPAPRCCCWGPPHPTNFSAFRLQSRAGRTRGLSIRAAGCPAGDSGTSTFGKRGRKQKPGGTSAEPHSCGRPQWGSPKATGALPRRVTFRGELTWQVPVTFVRACLLGRDIFHLLRTSLPPPTPPRSKSFWTKGGRSSVGGNGLFKVIFALCLANTPPLTWFRGARDPALAG